MNDVAGPRHRHPNGEIDLVMPLSPAARFDGHGAGWVVYGPDSRTGPTVDRRSRAGALPAAAGRHRLRAARLTRRAGPAAPRRMPRCPSFPAPTSALAAAHRDPARLQRCARPDRTQPRRRARGQGAFIDDRGPTTYGELAARSTPAPNALTGLGVEPEQRVLLCLPTPSTSRPCSWAASRPGIVPVAVNTLLTTADYGYMLRDSRACALVVSARAAAGVPAAASTIPGLRHVIVSGATRARCRRARSTSRRCSPAPPTVSTPRRRPATTSASGSTRRARPAPPRARCTCTRA